MIQDVVMNQVPESLAQLHCGNNNSTVVCQYPGLAAYFWTRKLADLLSQSIAQFVELLGADGVYLDGYANAYMRANITIDLYDRFVKSGCFLDVNGDGKGESVDEAVAQADAWGRYFVVRLRQQLGKNATIVANAAGENSDPLLNGLTVEVWERKMISEKGQNSNRGKKKILLVDGILREPEQL